MIELIRTEPSMGDALLLGPLIRELKVKHPGHKLRVLTSAEYCGGVLYDVFKHNPLVDEVVLSPSGTPADFTYNCDKSFGVFEGAWNGNPPCGIAEFWLRFHECWYPGVDMMPVFQTTEGEKLACLDWEFKGKAKPMVGIVLRAGSLRRDWAYNNKERELAEFCRDQGWLPVMIDRELFTEGFTNCYARPLWEVAECIRNCAVVVTPDTGLLHLAQTVGTPTISLWGVIEPKLRTTGYQTTVLPRNPIPNCGQCWCCTYGYQFYSCLHGLDIEEIRGALSEIIAGAP